MRHRILLLLSCLACGGDRKGTVTLSTGLETDVLSRAPAPTSLIVEGIDEKNEVKELGRTTLPASNLSLGEQDAEALWRIRVRGVDATGLLRVAGLSLPIQFGALEGATIPVFVQRVDELARLPDGLDAREAPVTALIIGRYLLSSGGPDVSPTTRIYDTASLRSSTRPPTLPRTPRTLAAFGSKLLVVDDEAASWFELSSSEITQVRAPEGGSFAEVAGGAAVTHPNGAVDVVGAARTSGPPSQRVLRIAVDGALSFATLATPRAGAAVAWVEGRGLVVAGGSDVGAGVEVLAAGASAAAALPFPADPTRAAGATALDASHVVIAGGLSPLGEAASTRVVDLACPAACAYVTWAAPAAAVVRAQAAGLDATRALVVGDYADGSSEVFTVSHESWVRVPTKVPRRGARLVELPGKALAVVGGSSIVELYRAGF